MRAQRGRQVINRVCLIMPALSKSKLMACLQCPKRLWLEVHCPELSEHSAASEAAFAAGRSVGEVARKLYDPKGLGILIDVGQDGTDAAIARTRDLLLLRRPIFEAGFEARGAKAFADVLIPTRRRGEPTWRMVEVKSSAEVHDYQRNDIAIQAYVARKARLPLSSVAIAHVDTSWVYPGDDDYHGLLVEHDMTDEAFDLAKDVKEWIQRPKRSPPGARSQRFWWEATAGNRMSAGFSATARAASLGQNTRSTGCRESSRRRSGN